jgi:hypothetical protein
MLVFPLQRRMLLVFGAEVDGSRIRRVIAVLDKLLNRRKMIERE